MEDTILTRHPHGKKGMRINRAKYELVRYAIIAALGSRRLTFNELTQAVEDQLRGILDGSPKWYVTVVKLDMEARRELFRVEHSQPQEIQLS